MQTFSNIAWVFYLNEVEESGFEQHKVGKWMYFFNDKAFAEKICKDAVERGIVAESKHSNADTGVCCFYLNCDDFVAHKRILTYFLENRLIRKTKTGKLYNISFKLDDQTCAGEYGNEFQGQLKLSDFVDLYTGEWINDGH